MSATRITPSTMNRMCSAAGLALIVILGACSRDDDGPSNAGGASVDASRAAEHPESSAPVTKPGDSAPGAADGPADFHAYLRWAEAKLAERPAPVAVPETPRMPERKWPIIRLEDRFDQAAVKSSWSPAVSTDDEIIALGPFRSDNPGRRCHVQVDAEGADPTVMFELYGLAISRDRVGAIEIEIHQPDGDGFEFFWSIPGRIRVPVVDNTKPVRILVETDGFMDWEGPLDRFGVLCHGKLTEPIEIRSLRFLPRSDSFPEAAGARRVRIGKEICDAVYVHPAGEVRFENVDLPERAAFRGGVGVVRSRRGIGGAEADSETNVTFEVLVEDAGETHSVTTVRSGGAARWTPITASLGQWGGQSVTIVLRATGGDAHTVACFSNPTVYQPVADPPLLIFYLIDTLAAEHIDLYGYDRPTMPRLSALAERGVWFAEMFANSPRTVESAPDYLLSMPTERHGVAHYSRRVADGLVTFPESLHAAGFVTACYSTNAHVGPRQNLDQGIDHFFDYIPYTWTGEEDRTVPIEAALAWLEMHRDVPVFLYIHTMEPHDPYTPLPGYADRFDPDYDGPIDGTRDRQRGFLASRTPRDVAHVAALYDEEIVYADARLGMFVDALASAGLFDKANFFVTSDHGEEFLEHGFWTHQWTLHNELMRVPLVAWGPMVSARGRIDTPVSLFDIMPTMLELFDLPEPYPLEGRSLARLLRGEEAGARFRRPIFASNHTYVEKDGFVEFAMIDGQWKLMYRHRHPRLKPEVPFEPFALFDMSADPKEKTDVLAEHQDRARKMLTRLIRWRAMQAPYDARGDARQMRMDPKHLKDLESLGYIGGEEDE